MAGRPKRRAAHEVLWRLTREHFGADDVADGGLTPLDYACDVFASNKTNMTKLASLVSTKLPNGMTSISREVIRGILYDYENAKQRIDAAQKEQAYAMIEQRADKLDDDKTLVSEVDIRRAQLQSKFDEFRAASLNREVFGVKGAGVEVNVNLGASFLTALRAREVPSLAVRPVLGTGPMPVVELEDEVDDDAE